MGWIICYLLLSLPMNSMKDKLVQMSKFAENLLYAALPSR